MRIALELSRLWDIVARFCPGEAEQLQKRRVSTLTHFVKELNPTYYGGLIEEACEQLTDARYQLFDTAYRKMLQRSPYFEQPTRTPTADELPEIRRLCSLAAASIEEF